MQLIHYICLTTRNYYFLKKEKKTLIFIEKAMQDTRKYHKIKTKLKREKKCVIVMSSHADSIWLSYVTCQKEFIYIGLEGRFIYYITVVGVYLLRI